MPDTDPTRPGQPPRTPPIPCVEALDPQAVAFNTFADWWAQANGELLRAAQAAAWNAGVDFGRSLTAPVAE
jgi:hypothetical protein